MAPLLGLLLRLTSHRSPFLSTLIPTIGLAYAIQGATAIPSIAFQSERFYDLSGSLTYLSCAGLSLALPTLRARYAAGAANAGAVKGLEWSTLTKEVLRKGVAAGGIWNWRMLVLSAAVGLWATRLGTYLFQRILTEGHDSRFDKIRSKPSIFVVAFIAQATWVSLCLLPVISINALPPAATLATTAFTLTDFLGLALYLGGFALEVSADRQKSAWSKARAEKKHNEQFLTSGLWGKSRHPNYFGEVTLWTGIATCAAGVLCSSAGQVGMGLGGGIAGRALAAGMAGVSPGFVAFLLLKVSGIPMSENKYDRRFKDNKQYQEWKKNTPMFFPKLW